MLPFVAICLLMGVVTEVVAARLELWRYRLAWMRGFNIVVTFALVPVLAVLIRGVLP